VTSLGSEIESTPYEATGARHDRRTVWLMSVTESVTETPQRPTTDAPRSTTRRVGRLLTTRDGWLRMAELVIGDWASTLWAGFLVLMAFAAIVVTIGVVFGSVSAMIGAALLFVVYLIGRRRDSGR
jgi:hypothetical protein